MGWRPTVGEVNIKGDDADTTWDGNGKRDRQGGRQTEGPSDGRRDTATEGSIDDGSAPIWATAVGQKTKKHTRTQTHTQHSTRARTATDTHGYILQMDRQTCAPSSSMY